MKEHHKEIQHSKVTTPLPLREGPGVGLLPSLMGGVRGWVFLLSLLLTACGLIDIDPDSEAQIPTKMTFMPDTVYVMAGDTFTVQPVFEPDSVTNKSLIWLSQDPDIVRLQHDTLIAEQEGWARLVVTSLAFAGVDSIDVCVMEPWEMPLTRYPYEMVVYAEVSVHGAPMTSDMTLAAFSGMTIKGVGTPIVVGDKTLWRIRIYNDIESSLPYAETPITFWVYDRKTLQRYMFPNLIIYNGETYCTPSNPLQLTI